MSALLSQHLRPFEKYFKRADVVEVCINQPGEVWLETFAGWERKADSALSLTTLKGFASILATVSGQVYSMEVPMLSTSIPGYDFRIQIISGAMVESGFAAAIRVARARRFALESYFSPAAGGKDAQAKVEAGHLVVTDQASGNEIQATLSDAERLHAAVVAGKNILVAGGTSSGKTTLLNSIIQLIPPHLRLITVEDSRELVVDLPNKVNILKSKTGTDVAKVTYKDIINACMRMRPDRILLGELDVENTMPFLRLLNTGHGGSMATIHADSPDEAFAAMVMNAQLAGLQGPVEEYARRALDVIVHLQRIDRQTFKATIKYL